MSQFANPAGAAAQTDADAYGRSLLGILGDRDPISVLEELESVLPRLIGGLSDRDLRRPEAEGKWSVVEVVQHLADTVLVVSYRVRMILAHDEPPIQAYDQDLWANRLGYRRVDVNDALEQLRVLRRANLRLIKSLSPLQLERAGMHAERGRESVRRILQLEAGHDLVHRRQIERIKKAIQ